MANSPEGRDPDTLRMYWQAQWDRNAQLEEQRLSVSNYVIAGSVAALGIFSVGSAATPRAAFFLAVAVAVINLLAVVYGLRSEQWARLHKIRAREVLTRNWKYLHKLQRELPRPHGAGAPLRRLSFQVWIHVVIAFAAIALAFWR